MLCQFCSADLDALSPDDRQTHYNRHLDEPCQRLVSRLRDLNGFLTVVELSPSTRSILDYPSCINSIDLDTGWCKTEMVLSNET